MSDLMVVLNLLFRDLVMLKKLTALCLGLFLSAVIMGCGAGEPEAPENKTPPPEDPPGAEEEAAAPPPPAFIFGR